MEEKNLYQQGQADAQQWILDGMLTVRRLKSLCEDLLSLLRRSCRRLAEEPESEAGTWVLDNAWLALEAGSRALEMFRCKGSVPALRQNGRLPRIQEIGERLAEYLPEFTLSDAEDYLAGVTSVCTLTEEELSLLVPALELGLLNQLCTLCRGCLRGENQSEALSQLFSSLRSLSQSDLSRWQERFSAVDAVLRQDNLYGAMSDESRGAYRRAVSRMAWRQRRPEQELAKELMNLAQGRGCHVGVFLFPQQKHPAWYPVAVVVPSGAVAVLLVLALGNVWASLVLLFPVSEVWKMVLDFVLLRMGAPRPVLRMELKEGVPESAKTLCVIAALLTGADSGTRLAGQLEGYALANRQAGSAVRYGILADLPDSRHPMGEEERSWVRQAEQAVERLNRRWNGGFYLFFRQSVYDAADGVYRGWERKRGALLELAKLLRGGASQVEVVSGDTVRLAGTVYLLTLDSDTRLNVDAVRRLVGCVLHPLNRPVIDRQRRVVTSGYGVFQPASAAELSAAGATAFARIFAGQGGIDPYGSGRPELYHDWFDCGSYTGKGLIDVEALSVCMEGRFPEHQVLSHDLLEGCYLRTAFVGDVELSDGFPGGVLPWLRRQHRWMRGDWQTAPWLLPKVCSQGGQREKNPLSALCRWKIVDNLRRSLVPVVTFAALALGLCLTGRLWVGLGWTAAVSWWFGLLLSAIAGVSGGRRCRRFHAQLYTGFYGQLLSLLTGFLLLPHQAWNCASAVFTALWRMCVSHKNQLEWVTSGQAERSKPTLWNTLLSLLPGSGLGALVLIFAGGLLGRILGLVWILSPFLAHGLSRRAEDTKTLGDGQQAFLLHEAALIWRFFDRFLRPEDNFLPPDNVQELPAVGVAHRTSPTNIGLALLSCLAAVDLDLTEPSHAFGLIAHTLETVEQLEKNRGHLYNWYDTRTCQPIEPVYVSSVDSGNLCACLIALKEGLRALHQPELSARAAKLAAEMRFDFLYDPIRQLFHIGYDAEKKEYTAGWYDLLASEARQTSYVAIARGEVDCRHWQRLSRGLVGQNGYCGLVSWTGTMFEYFMPHLLLPARPGSLLYESLALCVCAQQRWVSRRHLPWGVSESGFAQMDANQNYQYKAHGIPVLALKRGLERELVLSPYSAFLALSVVPSVGTDNLRRFRDLGLEGKYGLYEAADFTTFRVGSSEKPLLVRSWMAHHQGMSLVALDNALRDSCMVRRFLADREMGAFQELLEEKIPADAPLLRREWSLHMERRGRDMKQTYHRSGIGCDTRVPACHPLSNGSYTVVCTDAGGGYSSWERMRILGEMSFRLEGNRTSTVLFGTEGADSAMAWAFHGGSGELHTAGDWYRAQQRITVEDTCNGELRELTVETDRPAELVCLLHPVLCPLGEYEAHPAFRRLSVRSEAVGGGVWFRQGDVALTALWMGAEGSWTTSRQNAINRAKQTPDTGTVLDPCLLLRVPVNGKTTLRLALAVGEKRESLIQAQGLLSGAAIPSGSWAAQSAGLQLSVEEQLGADRLASALIFQSPTHLGKAEGQPSLWQFGISGDDPLVLCRLSETAQLEDCMVLIGQYVLLRRCGIGFDLALWMPERGQLFHRLEQALGQRELSDLLGARCGIHLLTGTAEALSPVLGMARLCLDGTELPQQQASAPCRAVVHPLPEQSPPPAWEWTENTFVLRCRSQLPPVRWSHVLANPTFGWLGNECGTGHLWHLNAHENKLTPWQNDPLSFAGPETLSVHWNNRQVSLFAARDGWETTVRYGAGWMSWSRRNGGQRVHLTAFVPMHRPQRLFLVEVEGIPEPWSLVWTLQPQMAARSSQSSYVTAKQRKKGMVLQNSVNRDFPGETLYLTGAQEPETAAWSGGQVCLTYPAGTAVLCAGIEPLDVGTGEASALLEETKACWQRMASPIEFDTPDEGLNHYLNSWCRYQVIACRLYSRCGLYQCGGAYGFRDQLQDVGALMSTQPDLAKEQILRCCQAQYTEGDVQHWWHPDGTGAAARGVRTRVSDDLLWLPYAAAQWVEQTGDTTLLRCRVPYLTSRKLSAKEQERYEQPQISEESGTVYDHCVRAIECVLGRGLGEHGLCRMGTGDWNDGMNLVGAKGKGESVWLTWFAALVLRRFATLCVEELQRGQRYRDMAQRFAEAADKCWNGAWYLRAYDDAGNPVGASGNEECEIDSIAQSFAVFAPGPSPSRNRIAVESAVKKLYDRTSGTVALLTPPFSGKSKPGYISRYPAGVRENGGQYTHAAVWLAKACFQCGRTEDGYAILHDLLPEHHPSERYQLEPFVLAGDVSTAPGLNGRGGWSWYTGAAGWYWQTAVEELMGIRLRGNVLTIKPQLPAAWDGYRAKLRLCGKTLSLTVRRGMEWRVCIGSQQTEQGIDLKKVSNHAEITVETP